MSLVLFVLLFLALVAFGAIQLWLGARLIKASRQDWATAWKAALYCVLLSFPVHLLLGQSPASSVINFVVGTVVIRRVLGTNYWRALALSAVLAIVSLAIAYAITGIGRLDFSFR